MAAAAAFLLDVSGALEPFALKAHDGLFFLNAKLGFGKQAPASPLVLIKIDDRTLAEPRYMIPRILWHNYFASVIAATADGGAKVIGLDFLLPQVLFDDLVPDYSRAWLRALLHARRMGAPVVTGVSRVDGRLVTPEPRYLQVIGPEHIGLFNLTTDSDDFCRRQRLVFPGAAGDGRKIIGFGYLLAKTFRPDLPEPPETVLINYIPGPAPFPSLSFKDVLEKAEAGDQAYFRNHFQGRLVLIGETNALTPDRRPTPLYYLASIGPGGTAGVEIAAHLVLSLLAGDYGRELNLSRRPLFYFILALPVALATLLGGFGAMAATFFLAGLVLFALALAAFSSGLALPVAGG
ncbi:MAG: CHASE2 domain-containing protein, partial [Pseudomonadota bacterium]